MYNSLLNQRPPVGSLLARSKGPLTHRGIYVGDYFGYDQVLENSPGKGESLVSFEEFAQGHPVKVERQVPFYPMINGVREALRVGRAYDFLTNNCEHTVTRIADGVARSAQVGLCLGAAFIGLLAFAATRD